MEPENTSIQHNEWSLTNLLSNFSTSSLQMPIMLHNLSNCLPNKKAPFLSSYPKTKLSPDDSPKLQNYNAHSNLPPRKATTASTNTQITDHNTKLQRINPHNQATNLTFR